MAAKAESKRVALKVGDVAPDFKDCVSVVGKETSKVSLSDFAGKLIVIYFYPKDDTPTCTLEGVEFSKLLKDFAAANTVVYGASNDDAEAHTKFSCGQKYSVPLICDPSKPEGDSKVKPLVNAYQATKDLMGYRITFLIDGTQVRSGKGDFKILSIWGLSANKVSDMAKHAKEVLDCAKKSNKSGSA